MVMSTGNQTVGESARHAIQFLHSAFSSKSIKILGQKRTDYLPTLQEYIYRPGDNNDDGILQACLYAHAIVANHVLLLTHDKNLNVKAMMHQLHVVSSFFGSPLDLVHEVCSRYGIPRPAKAHGTVSRDHAPVAMMDVEYQDPLLRAIKSLESVFISTVSAYWGKTLQAHFHKDDDASWTSQLPIQPPWTLSDLLSLSQTCAPYSSLSPTPLSSRTLSLQKSHSRSLLDLERCSRTDSVLLTKGDLIQLFDGLSLILRDYDPNVLSELEEIRELL